MDESLQELENELKRLRPRRPSPVLTDRIERDLRSAAIGAAPERFASATSFRSWKWHGWQWAAAAAAAAVTGVFFFAHRTGPVQPDPAAPAEVASHPPQNQRPIATAAVRPAATAFSPADSYRPVEATNVLYDLQDEGTVYVGNDLPAHRVRYRYVDTYMWKNPATHASLKWSVPREEVRVIPASLN